MAQNWYGNKSVLVTGASGLVGSHVVLHLLRTTAEVHVLIRSSQAREALLWFLRLTDSPRIDSILWHTGDATCPIDLEEAMQPVSVVFHCAGMVSFSKADAEALEEANVVATRNIVNAALLKGIEKLCYVSSVAALGKNPEGGAINENCEYTPSKPVNPYKHSKYNAELEVWRGIAEGLPAVIVNPTVVLGFSTSAASSAALFNAVAKGLRVYPSGSTGYVSADNLAQCMLLLTAKPILHERFIISAQELDYKTLFGTIADAMHIRKPHIAVPNFILSCAARIAKIIPGRLFNPHTLHSAYSHSKYDNTKAVNALQFQFTNVQEELKRISALYVSHRVKKG